MHIITGEIRKEPRIKQTKNGTLYVVELSERYKDREGNAQYTNYTFFFNAKTDGMKGWYDEAFQAGKVISVSCRDSKHKANHGKTTIRRLISTMISRSKQNKRSLSAPFFYLAINAATIAFNSSTSPSSFAILSLFSSSRARNALIAARPSRSIGVWSRCQ